ncbi:hypothetical protein EDD90_10739 [Streptomyces sp. Ag109_O5-1]|uniref:hypothetical protein n=1 Tax=Streptomyces sp. Ag109_O5-1 TaxID=1938851 RepID=UPI000F4E2D57|nr:hypothetical protein [Streptomyces sp. Ag109_O5-1]RPE27067.1 hypothetical protein EDD90_10739 [Streptomyces sp. Ag109_O5-1]
MPALVMRWLTRIVPPPVTKRVVNDKVRQTADLLVEWRGPRPTTPAARDGDGRLEIFGTNAAGQVFNMWQWTLGGAWSDWNQFDGELRQVAAQANPDGRLELFGVNGGRHRPPLAAESGEGLVELGRHRRCTQTMTGHPTVTPVNCSATG